MPSDITTALTSLLATATMKVAVTITARGVACRNWLAGTGGAVTTAAIA